jgi:hypothetical protein
MLKLNLLAVLGSPAVLVAQSVGSPAIASPQNPDPIVLEGRQLKNLLGEKPDSIVAFAFRAAAWQQIPVQIDERAALPFQKVLRRRFRGDPKSLFYTDPNTFTGADPDVGFDADDELVILADDAGAVAPKKDPKGVAPKSRVELRLKNARKDHDHVYLFVNAAKLRPAAGTKHVRYEFKLVAGDYKDEYELGRRFNPEQSKITTPAYRLGFRDRWILDELRLTVGAAQGVDILDRHKVQVIPGNCIRTTKTFCNGPGAMIANIDGPIRAIRAVLGANSGPLTERLWICYPRRFEIITHLRVHTLPSTLMFFDYSADALGMRYHDNNNPKGSTIDGKPDAIKPGKLRWQFLTGKQGSLLIHYELDTSIKRLVETSLYDDSREPKWSQCTGDAHSYGASGPLIRHLSNTDPRFAKVAHLMSRVILYPGAPDVPLQDERVTAPRTIEVSVH